jgi:hypothetical protein
MMTEAAAAADSFTRSGLDDLVPDSRWPNHHRVHRFVPAVELLQASRYRTILIRRMQEALQGVDLYVEITWSTNCAAASRRMEAATVGRYGRGTHAESPSRHTA